MQPRRDDDVFDVVQAEGRELSRPPRTDDRRELTLLLNPAEIIKALLRVIFAAIGWPLPSLLPTNLAGSYLGATRTRVDRTWWGVGRKFKTAVGSLRCIWERYLIRGFCMLGRASDEEGLRLMIAFFSIMEPDKRDELLRLAESLATRSAVVDGVTHFTMLAHRALPETFS